MSTPAAAALNDAGAAPTDPRVDLQRLFPIAPIASLGSATGFSDDAVQFAEVTCAHEATWHFQELSETARSDLRFLAASDRHGSRPSLHGVVVRFL